MLKSSINFFKDTENQGSSIVLDYNKNPTFIIIFVGFVFGLLTSFVEVRKVDPIEFSEDNFVIYTLIVVFFVTIIILFLWYIFSFVVGLILKRGFNNNSKILKNNYNRNIRRMFAYLSFSSFILYIIPLITVLFFDEIIVTGNTQYEGDFGRIYHSVEIIFYIVTLYMIPRISKAFQYEGIWLKIGFVLNLLLLIFSIPNLISAIQ